MGRAQLYSRVPVSHDSVTVSQHAQYQEPETESRWMELSLTMVLFTLDSFIYKSWDSLWDKGSYCQQIPRKDQNQQFINPVNIVHKHNSVFFQEGVIK